MAPHAEISVSVTADGMPTETSTSKTQNLPTQETVAIDPQDEYSFTFNNQDGFTPLELGDKAEYTIGEHIMWAPRKMRVGCIGAGAAGLMLCYKKEKEFGDDIHLVVYERYPSPGGVWFSNRYPGCRCDVPSAGYQFSFHPSPEWPKYYSQAEDICKYYCDFAESHNYVEKYIKLNHEVTRTEWNQSTCQWRLFITETYSSGEKRQVTDDVDFLVGNIGVLNTWKWPDIPNRESFKGAMTHSGNYDTSIDYRGKRVCVIGSGASTLQIIPTVQKEASHVVSFYRTPQWVGPGLSVDGWTDAMGRNFTYTEEQKQRFRDDPKHYLEFRKAIENKINGSFRGNIKDHVFQKKGREMITKHMRTMLKDDPKLTAKLIPDFAMGCRRLGPGEGFLEALTADNVTVADSGIDTFTETGIRCKDGTEYDVDIIICATGFDVSFRPYFPVIGRGGKSLAEEWTPTPEAYLALAAHGFPNFMIGSLGPNCPAGHGSFVTVLESAQNYICKVIRKMQTENIQSLDVKAAVVKEYNEHVHKWLQRTVWTAGCRSWYNQGKPDGKVTAQYPGSLVHWRELLREPRYEDFDLGYRSVNRFKFMGNGFTKDEVDGKDLAYYLEDEYVNAKLFAH